MKKNSLVASILTLCFFYGLIAFSINPAAAEDQHAVLVTTFPIYQIVRNITQGREGLKVELMLPSRLGCPHDYTLTPQDMRKLSKADILVINGRGMEDFLDSTLKKVHPKITVIDSAAGINDLENQASDHTHQTAETHPEDRHEHYHTGLNPHLFISPRLNVLLAENIAAEFAKIDPNGADLYRKNYQDYARDINNLAAEITALSQRLKNNRIISPHDVFDYLARDLRLEIVATFQHHGQESSAAEIRQLIKIIRPQQIGAIITEAQSKKLANSLAQETGVPIALIDSLASGPETAPLNYYSTVMRQNIQILASTLGVK